MFAKLETAADRDLALMLRASLPMINLVSYEETRVLESLKTIRNEVKEVLRQALANADPHLAEDFEARGMPLVSWSLTDGARVEAGSPALLNLPNPPAANQPANPHQALDACLRSSRLGGVFVFRDLQAFLDKTSQLYDPWIVRRLLDIAREYRLAFQRDRMRRTLILLTPWQVIPPELEKEMGLVFYPVPERPQLDRALESFLDRTRVRNELTPAQRRLLIDSSLGLTLVEVEDAWQLTMAGTGGVLDTSAIDSIVALKKSIIAKSGLLEYTPSERKFEDSVGGLESLKNWLGVRRRALERSGPVPVCIRGEERQLDLVLPPLRGVLLMGIPGCGKSLSAKAVAAELQVPLVRLDVGRLYEALLGKAEENLRKALRTVEELAPCVLWIDEIEKAFSQGSGVSDSGVSQRILGTFLYWMQEKQRQVFVVATANDIGRMPTELTRKGRLDETFFVGLPNEEERRQILVLHLESRGLPVGAVDQEELGRLSEGFTGAEIEQAIVNAVWRLSAVPGSDLGAALAGEMALIRPLSKRLDIGQIVSQAGLVAVNASRRPAAETEANETPVIRDMPWY